jgi:hypothetical protein
MALSRQRLLITTLLVAGAAGVAAAVPAHAADASGGYAQWVVGGTSGAREAAGTPAAGFPVAQLTSNATTVQAPSGATTFLGPATPVGQEYGSSQGMSYLNISTAASGATSTTTLTFDKPTPASKWAFVLGDIDADMVRVTATDASGNPVNVADLGFMSVFNYCAFSPKPGSCIGPATDVPTWIPDTATLVGNIVDTSGASGWFQPTVAIKTLTLTFTRRIGIPVFQLWLASKAVPVETIISGVVSECEPRLELLDADGQPILDAAGQPVVAKADEEGHARFAAVADGKYIVKLVTPKCGEPDGPTEVPITVDTSTGAPVVIPAGTFRIVVVLPDTGTPIAPYVSVGLGLILLGLSLRRFSRLR